MTPKNQSYVNLAKNIMPNYEKRGFECAFAADKEEALEMIKGYLAPGKTIANGGSVTLNELGFNQAVAESGAIYLDRFAAKTQEEKDAVFSKIAICDYYFMSTNAMTLDGHLLNIDGTGNRIASLIHGPKNVIIVAGMNKVCTDIESAYKRIKLNAAPPNTVRLGYETPCSKIGHCVDCLSPGCICTHTVITRRSNIPGRIKIIFVGEDLGL